MYKFKKSILIVLALVMVLATAGCTSTPPAAPATPAPSPAAPAPAAPSTPAAEPAPAQPNPADLNASLTLYTSEPEDLAAEMIADFNKIYPNVKIEVFRSGTGNVISKIDTELETGSTEANIVWFADIGYIKQLDEKGLILHFSPPSAASVSDEYKYENGMGHEVRLIYNVLAYNTTQVSTPPTDWMDVTGEQFKGKFAMANPNYSGGAFTALVVHTKYDDLVGWKFYEDAAANDCKYEQSNGALQTKVSSGEYAGVAIVDFMARNAKNDGSPVEVVWPASGAVLIPTPVSIINNVSADQQAAAEAFVDYMFQEATQKLFVSQGYIPVMSGIEGPVGAPKSSDIKTMAFDLDYYVQNSSDIRTTYVEKFGE